VVKRKSPTYIRAEGIAKRPLAALWKASTVLGAD
jgi:hypothetical protein